MSARDERKAAGGNLRSLPLLESLAFHMGRMVTHLETKDPGQAFTKETCEELQGVISIVRNIVKILGSKIPPREFSDAARFLEQGKEANPKVAGADPLQRHWELVGLWLREAGAMMLGEALCCPQGIKVHPMELRMRLGTLRTDFVKLARRLSRSMISVGITDERARTESEAGK